MSEMTEQDRVAERTANVGRSYFRVSARSPLFICGVAFAIRLLAMFLIQSSGPAPFSGVWQSGPEIVNIAQSISSHKGFSSPFGVESGPTAWIPPVYPALVAGIFWLFGVRSTGAAVAILAMQALFSALTSIPLFAIADRLFNDDCAVWASCCWALFPYEVVMPGLFVWETFISGLLAVWLCYGSMDTGGERRSKPVFLGLLWGAAALTNTALIALMPVFLVLPHFETKRAFPIRKIAITVVVAVLVVCPWIIRTRYELGAVVPVRSNFGEELWLGNHEGGAGRIDPRLGPAVSPVERERYRSLGEIAYIRQRRADALQFIRENPARFFRLVFYRFRYWWWGAGETAAVFIFYRLLTVLSLGGVVLALVKFGATRLLTLLGAIVIYPLVYYATDVYARYRYPIEPFLMLFAGVGLWQVFRFARKRISRV
jgi:Dolichyl-phosphate-mannose-protein mannosyltransferase